MFSKRHYEFIAATLAEGRPPELYRRVDDRKFHQWRETCTQFADKFARSNSRFNRARFLKACGIQE